jgi:hypothetical protein
MDRRAAGANPLPLCKAGRLGLNGDAQRIFDRVK